MLAKSSICKLDCLNLLTSYEVQAKRRIRSGVVNMVQYYE